jgi:1-acyl-sn-glycerol-3-phosphate acyltransferase
MRNATRDIVVAAPGPRTIVIALASGLFVTLASLLILPIAAATGFSARRLYARYTTGVARALLWFWGVRVRRHGRLPDGGRQVVYVSNHSSTLDLFVLVALGLPNTRFFLSGFLQKFVPLAILARLMGTFFTVPQDRPEERRRIFVRAGRTLARSGESVYLSPEGGRITTGAIGAFNKGAFHLATALGAPIVPLYFVIPSAIDPGMGYVTRRGIVDVFVKPSIDTRDWRIADVPRHRDLVRDRFVRWHEDARHLRHAEPLTDLDSSAAPVNA